MEDNAVRNRFTAYLKASVEHNAARYTKKIKEKKLCETGFPENETVFDGLSVDSQFEHLFAGEIGDSRLQKAFSALRDIERSVLVQHLLQDRTLKLIALEMSMPYPTVKSLYRRSLEKLREELMKDEF